MRPVQECETFPIAVKSLSAGSCTKDGDCYRKSKRQGWRMRVSNDWRTFSATNETRTHCVDVVDSYTLTCIRAL